MPYALQRPRLHFERTGAGEPLLCITGFTISSAVYEPVLPLWSTEYECITYDNRGSGRSGVPRWTTSMPELAADAARLLDALGVSSAHVFGISMGGMIAQELAIGFPERLLSLTSIMSTTGDPKLPGPTRAAMRLLLASPPRSREEFLGRYSATWNLLRAGSFPEDEVKDPQRAERTWDRGNDPAGAGRQLRAIFASGDRTARLAAVKVPALVIHGEVDPLVRPAAGKATAAAIPGAKLVMIPRMGHALPMSMWPEIIDAIASHAHGAARV